MMENLLNKVRKQALAELPQSDSLSADSMIRDYINSMNNYEFLELLDRACEVDGE